jgi:hypothetical protein
MFKDLTYVSIRLQKKICRTVVFGQKNGKGQQEWTKAYVEFGLALRKLNTLMKTRQVFYLMYCCVMKKQIL